MKKFRVLLSVLCLSFGLLGVANAVTINYNYIAGGAGNNEFTSPYFATVENFNGAISWTWTGSYAIVSGDSSGKYAAPLGVDGVNDDTTKYVTVPNPTTGGNGSVMVTNLGGTWDYFGLWWGSIDTYNTITFYLNGNPTGESFTGIDVTTPGSANGNQVSPASNHYVNFVGLLPFNQFQMSSTQFAFEADNITLGYQVVPEPTTILLLGLGLVGLAGIRRKF